MQKNITSLGSLNWDDLKFFLEVARTRKASTAAKRLAVDYTTVSRRISSLEAALGTLLFEKSRTSGFVLTTEGQRLLGLLVAGHVLQYGAGLAVLGDDQWLAVFGQLRQYLGGIGLEIGDRLDLGGKAHGRL